MYAGAGIEAARVKAYRHVALVDKGLTTSVNSNKLLNL